LFCVEGNGESIADCGGAVKAGLTDKFCPHPPGDIGFGFVPRN